jgi:hypothetical protein
LAGALYLFLPVAAAVLILVRRGGPAYLTEEGPWLRVLLEWVVGLYAFLFFVTDRLPHMSGSNATHLQIEAGGWPTPTSALLRLITSLPHAVFVALFSTAASFVSLYAAFAVLVHGRYSRRLYHFQAFTVEWAARLLAYHASLVSTYPPFVFDEHDSHERHAH